MLRISDFIKWSIIIMLLTTAIIGNHFYCDHNLLLRIVLTTIIIVIAGSLISMTTKGKSIISFINEAHIEVRKVIWPSRQEAFHTTLIIAVVTIITAMLLWGLDTILVQAVSFITNLDLGS
ncbi:preprotein translocase subunit SecE [Sodalis sp. CWE]|uniref:preprotein translocase subunit SecE n=1 Tax=Sodalis sp. CWE TaxID=2803816 RepID=UPI001C7D2954|nr:preprotein translocase subunit SecE [Sodalis sp. CWE]MBX4181107.1 preprotein translocase subunit SecE [Sodalis sp. CWE]